MSVVQSPESGNIVWHRGLILELEIHAEKLVGRRVSQAGSKDLVLDDFSETVILASTLKIFRETLMAKGHMLGLLLDKEA